MISNVKFNELANRVDLLVEKILHLEAQVKSLTDSQGGEIPPGMTPVATLAAEYGISTKKAEELAKNSSGKRLGSCCEVLSANMALRTGSIL